MLGQPRHPSRLIFDVDSTVLVVYGKQAGARIGYNPIKRGRPSHHPLLCCEGQSKNFWPDELRAGDVRTATGTRDLLAACVAKVPAGIRLVVVRADKRLTLLKLGRYHYEVLLTNLPWHPLNLCRLYNDRAGIELLIKQLKGEYVMGNIPTRHFFANETYFHLLLFAYNLLNWFCRLCLPDEFQRATLQTLRYKILLTSAQLLRTGNCPRLVLPASGTRQTAWEYTMQNIEYLHL